MKRKSSVRAILGALLMGGLLLVAPAVSNAATITTVDAFSGGILYSLWGGGLPTALSTAGPLTSLILIQTISDVGNFDTSDQCGPGTNGPSCGTLAPPSVTVNGQIFIDGTITSNVLGFNYSGGNPTDNESHEWKSLGVSAAGDFEVFVGYADNSHLQGCVDAGGNCHPDGPWIGDSGVKTIGSLLSVFDTGAILIVARSTAVPEPATLLLLGAGLAGLAAWGKRRNASNV